MPNRPNWHPCFLPDNYRELMKKYREEQAAAIAACDRRLVLDSDVVQEEWEDE